MMKISGRYFGRKLLKIFWSHDVENISTIFWSQVVEGLNCTGWDQGDKPFLIARIAGRMYVDVSQSFANRKLKFSLSRHCADYKRRNWRESASNPCYRWTFIEAFWSEVQMIIVMIILFNMMSNMRTIIETTVTINLSWKNPTV